MAASGRLYGLVVMVVVVAFLVGHGGQKVAAEMDHVVGSDRGWDPSSDLASWLSGREFRVGDKICKFLFLS